jgi:glutathione S-transferase
MNDRTIKLFYSPAACSLAPHIILEEIGLKFEPVRVLLSEGQQKTPEYRAINPKARVPALAVGDWVLTENPAILLYLARLAPELGLWPEDIELDARCAEWVAWISSTVHVGYGLVGRPERAAKDKDAFASVMAKGHELSDELARDIDRRLGQGPWALGQFYSVVDPYLLPYWLSSRQRGIDVLTRYPEWTRHAVRLAGRPAVKRAFERENLQLPSLQDMP